MNNGDSVEKVVMKKNKNGKMNKYCLIEEKFVEVLDDFFVIYYINLYIGFGGYFFFEVW